MKTSVGSRATLLGLLVASWLSSTCAWADGPQTPPPPPPEAGRVQRVPTADAMLPADHGESDSEVIENKFQALMTEQSDLQRQIRARESALGQNEVVRGKLEKIDEQVAALRRTIEELETSGRRDVFKQADPELAALYERDRVLAGDVVDVKEILVEVKRQQSGELRKQHEQIVAEIRTREEALRVNEEFQKRLADIDARIHEEQRKRNELLRAGKLNIYEKAVPEVAALMKQLDEITARIAEMQKKEQPDHTELRRLIGEQQQLRRQAFSKEQEARRNTEVAKQLSAVYTEARQVDQQLRQLREERREAQIAADPQLAELRKRQELVSRKLRELPAGSRHQEYPPSGRPRDPSARGPRNLPGSVPQPPAAPPPPPPVQ